MSPLIKSILSTRAGYGLTILRIVVGIIFAAHGSQKLFGWFGGYGLAGTAQWMESIGLAPGTLMALLSGGTEFFAGLALMLAAIGIYGVMSYAVSQRTSEIGIRLALGAEARDILRMIVGNAVRLAALGLGIGVVLALALGRTLSSLLFRTPGTDPLTFAAVVGVLGAVALAASYFPARRASRIPPVDALRYQ